MSPAVKGSAMLFNVMMFKEKVVTTVEVWGQKSEHYWHKKASDWTVQPKCERERERKKEGGGGPQTDFLHFIPDPQLTGRQAGKSGEGVYACLNVCVLYIYIYVCMCVHVCVHN